MAIEQNPFEAITQATSNVVNLPTAEETTEATFEVEPDGGVLVDFSQEIEMSPDEDIAEWYGNLAEDIEEEILQEIGTDVVDNFIADKDSRAEWESMFERG